MVSHFKLMLAVLAILSFGLVRAQVTGGIDGGDEDLTTLPSLPYIAEVTGQDVYVRSGGGNAFYYTSKLSSPARVTVVEHLHGWSKIIPPAGSFSWISKEYVETSATVAGVGLIKNAGTEGVRVWAGSDYVEPMRSFQMQVRLHDGDMVRLIEPESQKGDYYKIVPPSGAYLWMSSRFLRYIQPLPRPVLSIAPERKVEPQAPVVQPRVEPRTQPRVEPNVTVRVTPTEDGAKAPTSEPRITLEPTIRTTTPTDGSPTQVAVTPEIKVEVPVAGVEAKRIQECYDLAEKITAELEKPLVDQNYDEYKNALTAILNDEGAGRAQRYAEYQLQQVARFELARLASGEIVKQDAALQKVRQQIRQDFKEKLAEIPNPGKYIIKGTLQPSLVFTGNVGKKRYRVLSDEGKTLCYAVGAEGVISAYADRFIGRKVGLKGTIVSDKNNPVGLVTFTAIEELPVEKTETAKNK